MKFMIHRVLLVSLLLLLSVLSLAQQVADPDFDVTVKKPAYTKKHPVVFLDEAHHNFHTASGRYKPFADLITNDGYEVIPNEEVFQQQELQKFDILVIAN